MYVIHGSKSMEVETQDLPYQLSDDISQWHLHSLVYDISYASTIFTIYTGRRGFITN